jgi:3,4-dihydroxyphenylacetate 2,3-dioxygenase
MTGALLASAVMPHTPLIAAAAEAPDALRGVVAGSIALGEAVRALRPDLLVVQSSHWVTPFFWFVATERHHAGLCPVEDAISTAPAIPYDRAGDPEFGRALAAGIAAAGMPATPFDAADFVWDYGTCIPLRHLDPEQRIPVVLLSTCMMASLDDCRRVGATIRRTAEETGKRVVFVASSAFAHRLMPQPQQGRPEQKKRAPQGAVGADRRFLDMLCTGDIAAARNWLPLYAKLAQAELGGRPLATFLGCTDETSPVSGRCFGEYGRTSGIGCVNVAVWPPGAEPNRKSMVHETLTAADPVA